MMPDGPDRAAVFERAQALFADRGGNNRLASLRVLEKTRAAYEQWLDRRDEPDARPAVGVREGLRATLAIEKAEAGILALREQCFHQAAEELFQNTHRRAWVQQWPTQRFEEIRQSACKAFQAYAAARGDKPLFEGLRPAEPAPVPEPAPARTEPAAVAPGPNDLLVSITTVSPPRPVLGLADLPEPSTRVRVPRGNGKAARMTQP
jgi:hypothetical protein